MAKDYLTYNESLNLQLGELGFKRKNMNRFIRKSGDVIQILSFTHHTNGEQNVRYYDIMVHIEIPQITELSQAIGVSYGGFGQQICYCVPGGHYDAYRWRVETYDADKTIKTVIDRMVNEIIEVAIPHFFEKYDTIDRIVKALEDQTLRLGVIKRQLLPLLYLSQNRKQTAFNFMHEELKLLSTIKEEDDRKLSKGYELPGFKRKVPWVNIRYTEYLQYVNRVTEFIDSHQDEKFEE